MDLEFDLYSNIIMLNKNCLIMSFVSLPGANSIEKLRVYDACDSYDTGAKGSSLALTHDGNFLLAGSKSGNFYYALLSGKNNPVAD